MKTHCHACDESVTPEWVDEGIGHYEYWGAHGFDQQFCAYCPECGMAIGADFDEYLNEMRAEAADARYDMLRDDVAYVLT